MLRSRGGAVAARAIGPSRKMSLLARGKVSLRLPVAKFGRRSLNICPPSTTSLLRRTFTAYLALGTLGGSWGLSRLVRGSPGAAV
eukprot:CAMPEP_0119266076 /NCGR_PEP_ID=MMETSP1329-20130426/4687_1 /TAXON_ID=114041 /ORGANISM="Genus nov. species nov., Strain RCC1024" /LENGTH=84 /DNA_ID=CAMNT_0007265939 /DNA_START=133 /DNA_END=387 /DNA_ORIENTATION=+